MILIIIITCNLIYQGSVFRINRTVNWGYDVTHILAMNFLGITSWFIFILGIYGIFKMLKIQTEFVSSVIFIILLLMFKFVLPNFPQLAILTLIIGLILVVAFWVNIYASLKSLIRKQQ